MEFYKHEYYLSVGQLNGSSTNARHHGASKIIKFDFAQYYTSYQSSLGSGTAVGKPKLITPSDFSFEMDNKDVMFVRLLRLFFEGRHIPNMIATEDKLTAKGELVSFISYKFKDCIITSAKKSQYGNWEVFTVDFESFESTDNHVETWSN